MTIAEAKTREVVTYDLRIGPAYLTARNRTPVGRPRDSRRAGSNLRRDVCLGASNRAAFATRSTMHQSCNVTHIGGPTPCRTQR